MNNPSIVSPVHAVRFSPVQLKFLTTQFTFAFTSSPPLSTYSLLAGRTGFST